MTFFDKIKTVAEETQGKKEAQRQREGSQREAADLKLAEVVNHIVVLINDLDHRPSSYGQFEVTMMRRDSLNIFATISAKGRKVAWFKAQIVNGTLGGSDDCEGVAYLYPLVTCRVYPPGYPSPNHDGSWDFQEQKSYYNGGMGASCSSLEDMPKFESTLATYFASWFA